MRKVIAAFLLFLSTLMLSVQPANASSPGAADIFNTIGGTTTIDRGGSIHSQARSIYSLGGGMVSFEGKKVSLLSADPPSFSAGCSGISWHFGGFAFISLDEIRQLVEAVAQASLGVAVDLAMQTLCPQCYAVMAKLRDISNMMRNAAADACKIAENMASMLKDSGLIPNHAIVSDCSKTSADSGQTSSWMDSAAGEACKLLSDATDAVTNSANKFMAALRGGNGASDGKTQQMLSMTGNVTYKALTALGYPDGVTKDVMLSLLGLTIISPTPDSDCKAIFANLTGSSSSNDTGLSSAEQSVLNNLTSTQTQVGVQGSNGQGATVNNTTDTPAQTQASGAAKGGVICNAPPLISGFEHIGRVLMCGYYTNSERAIFANQYFAGHVDLLDETSLGAMCPHTQNEDAQDPVLYDCKDKDSAQCINPSMKRMSTVFGSQQSNGYTGLLWMIGDALYQGAICVQNNCDLSQKTNTIAILNGSGYPLYRLLNMAAVYPGLASDLLNAYTSAIATQYVMDTLDKLMKIGAQPAIDLRTNPGLKPESISMVREQLMELTRNADSTKNLVLERLAEKRKLVEVILQVNKTMQAEVIGQGLSGNTDLAVALKRQTNAK
jgi:hypothetical protein